MATLLNCRFRYLIVSEWARAAETSSALAGPIALPCRLRLSKLGHFSRYFAKIYSPTSVSSLKDKSTWRTSFMGEFIPSRGSTEQRWAEWGPYLWTCWRSWVYRCRGRWGRGKSSWRGLLQNCGRSWYWVRDWFCGIAPYISKAPIPGLPRYHSFVTYYNHPSCHWVQLMEECGSGWRYKKCGWLVGNEVFNELYSLNCLWVYNSYCL